MKQGVACAAQHAPGCRGERLSRYKPRNTEGQGSVRALSMQAADHTWLIGTSALRRTPVPKSTLTCVVRRLPFLLGPTTVTSLPYWIRTCRVADCRKQVLCRYHTDFRQSATGTMWGGETHANLASGGGNAGAKILAGCEPRWLCLLFRGTRLVVVPKPDWFQTRLVAEGDVGSTWAGGVAGDMARHSSIQVHVPTCWFFLHPGGGD